MGDGTPGAARAARSGGGWLGCTCRSELFQLEDPANARACRAITAKLYHRSRIAQVLLA